MEIKIKAANAAIDHWAKDIAPSTANKWINYGPRRDEVRLLSSIRHTMRFITTQLSCGTFFWDGR